MRRPLALLFYFLLVPLLSAQSPWTRSKAGFYVQGAIQAIPPYSALFSNNGDNQPLQRTLAEYTFQLYGEYGIREKTTLIAALPLRYVRSGNSLVANPSVTNGSVFGLGNVTLGVRQQITNGRLPLTFTLKTDLPATLFDEPTGLRTGYKSWTFLPMLSTGMGFRRAYWFAWGGYGVRTNNYSHLGNFGIEGGLKFNRHWLIAYTEWVIPVENGDILLPSNNLATGLFVNNQGYQAIGLKSMLSFGRFWGVSLTAAGAVSAQNVPRQPAFAVGGWFRWD
jgi:hypothetical protein